MIPKTNDYQLIDSGNFKKLEQVSGITIVRPSPVAIWQPKLAASQWAKAQGEYVRDGEKGAWKWLNNKAPSTNWVFESSGVSMKLEPTSFGHLGIFPEHHRNQEVQKFFEEAKSPLKVLNLFAYTGYFSLLANSLGHQVVHVDASKSTNDWAKLNASLSGKETGIRFITEDVKKFIKKELRRDSRYDCIILDPPSFGRGTKNEVWKLEEDLLLLLEDLKVLLAEKNSAIFLSCHTPGFTPKILTRILQSVFGSQKGRYVDYELCLVEQSSQLLFPLGGCSLFLTV